MTELRTTHGWVVRTVTLDGIDKDLLDLIPSSGGHAWVRDDVGFVGWGEAARFAALNGEYRKAPEVTRRRFYLETLGEILPQAGRKIASEGIVYSLYGEKRSLSAEMLREVEILVFDIQDIGWSKIFPQHL